MDPDLRVIVTADLCCECVRNAAYYRAGWSEGGNLVVQRDFWINLNGNFLDIAVLVWCYLFGDQNGEFRWQRSIDDVETFESDLLTHLKCTHEEFDTYIKQLRTYRDKRVAHRDRYESKDPPIQYPSVDIAVTSTCFLYKMLIEGHQDLVVRTSIENLRLFYDERLTYGRREYLEVQNRAFRR